jgi:hypothetical protein
MTHDPLCPWYPNTTEEVSCRICDVIARAREDESKWYVAAAKANWDAAYAFGLNEARQAMHYEERSMMRLRKEHFTLGLWTGWAIGTSLMVISLIVLAVTR